MPPKKDLQCFTKKANDGHKYVACIGSKEEKPKVKRKTNIKVLKQEGPRNLKKGFGIKRTPAAPPPPPPTPKRKTNIKVLKQQGPRNLKKGFGIKRTPRATPPAPTKAVSKKPERSRLTKLTGISPQDANKMDPAKLFGLLPVELRKKVLTSGTKVGDVVKVGRPQRKIYKDAQEGAALFNKRTGINFPFDEDGHEQSLLFNEEDGIKNMKNAINRYLKSKGMKQVKDIQSKKVERVIENAVQKNGADRAELNKIVRTYQKNIEKMLYYKQKPFKY